MPIPTITNRLRSYFWSRPDLYRPLGMLRGKGDVLRLDFDVMVEGYPRSANTYFSNLLKVTQPGLRVRTRAHIPCHAIAAARGGVPVLVLLRNPLDCVSSYAILKEERPTAHLFYYLAYHEVLRSHTDRMFLVDFDAATSSPLEVMRAFDKAFGLGLSLGFDFAQKHEEALALIEEESRLPDGSVNYRFLNRPTERRRDWKAEAVAELLAPANAARMARANDLYRELRSRAFVAP